MFFCRWFFKDPFYFPPLAKTMVHHQLSSVLEMGWNHQFVRWPFRKTVLGFKGCSYWQLLVENSCAYAKIKQHIMYQISSFLTYKMWITLKDVEWCWGPLFTRDLIKIGPIGGSRGGWAWKRIASLPRWSIILSPTSNDSPEGFVYPVSKVIFTGSSNTMQDISPSPRHFLSSSCLRVA